MQLCDCFSCDQGSLKDKTAGKVEMLTRLQARLKPFGRERNLELAECLPWKVPDGVQLASRYYLRNAKRAFWRSILQGRAMTRRYAASHPCAGLPRGRRQLLLVSAHHIFIQAPCSELLSKGCVGRGESVQCCMPFITHHFVSL